MMRTRVCSPARFVSALAVAAGALLAPTLAHAQFDVHDPQTGLEGSIYGGYGGFTNNAAFNPPGTNGGGNLLGSFGLQFFLGYRPIPVVSAGLHGGYNVLAVRNGTSTQGADAGAVGAYARVHVLSFLPRRNHTYAGTADLFLGVGFDFFAQVKAWDGGFSYHTSGIALPFLVGFNYAITDNVEIGVLGLAAAPWTASPDCITIFGIMRCTDHQSEAFLYIGLGVSGHFNFLH